MAPTVDIGAYEYTDPPPPLDPQATYYTVTDTSASAIDTGSLSYAIAQANANANTHGSVIEFDPTVFATQQTIGLASTLQLGETAGPEVIVGPSAGVVISGDNSGSSVGVFNVTKASTNATLIGLTISGGSATFGGGLYNSGTATLYDVTVSGNKATQDGGGIFTKSGGTTTLTRAVVTGNTAGLSGGGMFNKGNTTLNGYSVVSYNSAPNGYGYGGGIGTYKGTTTLSQCTVSGNTAGYGGGGLFTQNGTSTLSDCTVSGNTAGLIASGGYGSIGGGGLLTSNGGTTALTNCTISGNSDANGNRRRPRNLQDSTVTLTTAQSAATPPGSSAAVWKA